MTLRTFVFIVLVAGASPVFARQPAGSEPRRTAPAAAQAPRTPAPAQAPRAETPAPAARIPTPATIVRREGQPINVRIEFTLTDQRGSGAPVKRTVSMLVADGRTGQIRSQSEVFGIGGNPNIPLNIDASPELLNDGKIRLGFNLQYDWPAPLEQTEGKVPRGTVMKTSMHDSATLIVESGKAMTVAQSADPIGDRQVILEVKATVLR